MKNCLLTKSGSPLLLESFVLSLIYLRGHYMVDGSQLARLEGQVELPLNI